MKNLERWLVAQITSKIFTVSIVGKTFVRNSKKSAMKDSSMHVAAYLFRFGLLHVYHSVWTVAIRSPINVKLVTTIFTYTFQDKELS